MTYTSNSIYSGTGIQTEGTLFINSGDADKWTIVASGSYETMAGSGLTINVENKEKGYHPNLIFKYIKKNRFSLLGVRRYRARIKKIKKLAIKYAELSQDALSKKFLNRMKEEMKLAEIVGAGVRMFVKKSLVEKHKYNIKGGHISDTDIEKYTNPIPSSVLKKYKKIKGMDVFDEFVVYHYFNEKLEKKKEKKEKKISREEKEAMRDPILFGVCKELPDILFFIDEWDSEYCDLSFDELVDSLPINEEDVEIPKEPNFKLDNDTSKDTNESVEKEVV